MTKSQKISKAMSREEPKYAFNGKWLFKCGYNSRISHDEICQIVLNLQAENAELKKRVEKYSSMAETAERNLDLLERHQAWDVVDDVTDTNWLAEAQITHPIINSKRSVRYSLILTDSANVIHYFNHDGTYDGYAHDPHIDGKTGTCAH